MKKYGVVICGLGRAGSIHTKNCYENPNVAIKYLVEKRPEVAEKVKDTWGLNDTKVVPVDDFAEVLNDPDVHAVIICPPTYAHEHYVKQCIAKKKAMICEKPVAETLNDTVSCLKAAEEANVPLLVAFNRRFDETHSSLKKAITNGEVGNIQLLTISSRDSPRPSNEYLAISGGIFHDMAIHDIDMALWLINEYPTSVFTFGKAFDPYYTSINDVDTVAISMQFPSGAMAQISLSRLAVYGYDQRVEVFGDKGMVRSDNQSSISLYHANAECLSQNLLKYSFPQRYEKAYKAEIAHLVEMLEGMSCCITTQDVSVVSLVAAACEESLRTGKPVNVDTKDLSFQ